MHCDHKDMTTYLPLNNIGHTLEGMWGRRKRGGESGEGEHFYPLQHPKDRSTIIMQMVAVIMIDCDDNDNDCDENDIL